MATAVAEVPEPRPVEPLYRKLRPRPNGPPREKIVANQRARLAGALIEACAQRGYAEVNVTELCRLAGVSKRTFYEQYQNKEECFLASYEAVLSCGRAKIALEGECCGGEARLRRRLGALLGAIAERPNASRLVLEAPGAGARAVALRDRTRQELECAITADFAEVCPDASLPPVIARGIVLGLETVLGRRVTAGRTETLPGLAGELASWVLSYCSPALAALRDNTAAVPSEPATRLAPVGPSLRGERRRIVAAVGRIAVSGGDLQHLSLGDVAARAELPREVVARHYRSATECILDAGELAEVEVLTVLAKALRDGGGGASGIYLAVGTLLDHARRAPQLGVLATGDLPVLARALRVGRLPRGFEDLLTAAVPNASISAVGIEATAGAMWGVVRDYLLPAAVPPSGLVLDAAFLALVPLVGVERACETVTFERRPDEAAVIEQTFAVCV